ncbi:MAG: hypothetical protein U1F17_06945 [Burkholderiaceae bacterium]
MALMLPVDGSKLDEILQAIRLARGQLALPACSVQRIGRLSYCAGGVLQSK